MSRILGFGFWILDTKIVITRVMLVSLSNFPALGQNQKETARKEMIRDLHGQPKKL